MTRPTVTVCIPVYNMVATLVDSVHSVQSQSFRDWELIIVDNASTDGSAELAREFAATDSRIRVINLPQTVPMIENYNNCLRHAGGRYLAILSADDTLLPEFLHACLDVFQCCGNLGYVTTSHNLIDEHDRVTARPSFYHTSGIIPGREETLVNLAGNHSAPSYMLYNRQALASVGGFSYQFPYCFDIYTKLRLSLAFDIGYISKALCNYRLTSERGPSLYRHGDLSPLFELYQIKMKILGKLVMKERERKNIVQRICDNLARVSLSLADFAYSVKAETGISRQYLQFALGFSSSIAQTPRYIKLVGQLADKPMEEKIQGQRPLMSPPFDLPSNSRPLVAIHLISNLPNR